MSLIPLTIVLVFITGLLVTFGLVSGGLSFRIVVGLLSLLVGVKVGFIFVPQLVGGGGGWAAKLLVSCAWLVTGFNWILALAIFGFGL